ncbi:WXG100 family type VII secretion target [Nocardioides pacificus]
MNTGGLNVNHGALDNASQNLIAAARSIEARLNTLEDELRPLRSDWTGSAKIAYDSAKKKWDSAISEMILLLSDTGSMVQTSNDEYRAADQRGANRF